MEYVSNLIKEDTCRILLIDDDEEDYILTKDIIADIKNKNISLEWASTFDQGISKLESNLYEVLLVDYYLGEKNGISFLKYAKEMNVNKPIIFITGNDNIEIDQMAMREGAADYLVKGRFNADLLERSIRYSIHKKKIENELEVLNANKDLLFKTIAHDLRNSFQSLASYINFTIEDYNILSKKEIFANLNALNSISGYTSEMLNNLLLWAQNQWQGIKFNQQELQLYPIASEAIKSLSKRAFDKNIIIYNNLSPKLMVLGDIDLLIIIIRNLVGNAIKYNNIGGTIMINAEQFDKKYVSISVTDNGIGMSQNILENLFKSGNHKSIKGTNDEKGSGLGLQICKEFVEKHGGKIWADSKIDQGSKFTFILQIGENNNGSFL